MIYKRIIGEIFENDNRLHFGNECTKVQNPRRPRVRESLKAHA